MELLRIGILGLHWWRFLCDCDCCVGLPWRKAPQGPNWLKPPKRLPRILICRRGLLALSLCSYNFLSFFDCIFLGICVIFCLLILYILPCYYREDFRKQYNEEHPNKDLLFFFLSLWICYCETIVLLICVCWLWLMAVSSIWIESQFGKAGGEKWKSMSDEVRFHVAFVRWDFSAFY